MYPRQKRSDFRPKSRDNEKRIHKLMGITQGRCIYAEIYAQKHTSEESLAFGLTVTAGGSHSSKCPNSSMFLLVSTLILAAVSGVAARGLEGGDLEFPSSPEGCRHSFQVINAITFSTTVRYRRRTLYFLCSNRCKASIRLPSPHIMYIIILKRVACTKFQARLKQSILEFSEIVDGG